MTATKYPDTGLTILQERFATLLFQNVPQHEAYLQAGYSALNSRATVEQHASTLAANAQVVARIQALRDRAATDRVASVDERRQILTELIRAKLTDFVDDAGNVDLTGENTRALSELTIEDWRGERGSTTETRTKKIKLHSLMTAIDLLNKMDGTYSEAPTGTYNDNRTWNILVADQETVEMMARASKRTGPLLEAGHSEKEGRANVQGQGSTEDSECGADEADERA